MLRRLYPVVFLFSAPVAAQDITLTDGQSVTVSNGQVIDGIDGDINNVTGATITIEAGGVVTGSRDAFELGDTTDVTVIVYGTIDSADGGVVGTIYSNPPGNTADGDDAIVADDSTGLTLVLKDGALVLADDEFINGDGATNATITIEQGARVYAEDQGIDDVAASTITINGYLEVGDANNTSADGVDIKGDSVVTIGSTGEIVASDHGVFAGLDNNIIHVYGDITAGDDGINIWWDVSDNESGSNSVFIYEGASVDAVSDGVFFGNSDNTVEIHGLVDGEEDGIDTVNRTSISIGTTGSILAGDNGIEAEDTNNIVVRGSIVASDHGIDIGSDTASNSGNNVVVIHNGAVVQGTNVGINFDNGSNTVEVSGRVTSDVNAFSALGSSNSITFNPTARIIGNLNAATGTSGNTLSFDVGSAQSYVFATTGGWTLEDLDGRAVVEGSAMAAGIGNVETADEMMFDRAIGLDGSLARLERQATTGERQALFDAYSFSQSRDENGTTAAYELDGRGMTIGMPLDLLGHEAIAFVNYHDSEIDIASGTHDIDAQSLRFGLSVPQMWSGENYDIGLYAVAGRNSYDGTRDVLVNQNTTTGITTVDASWDSTELEIGADVTSNMALTSKLTLDSSLGLAVQVERVGAYSEQNYFAWNSRTIVQAHAKAELTLGYQASNSTRLYGTAGAWRRDVRSGATASYTINNTAVSYNGGVYDDTITSFRLGAGHSLANGAVVSAEAIALDSSNADSSWGASIGIAARF
jgi:hypothetical protein